MKIFSLIKPRYVLFIGLILIILLASSTYFELRQHRLELMRMHEYEGLALLKIIKQSAANSIASQSEIKDQITERLFNNARWLREVETHQRLTHSLLRDFAAQNNLYRINVFNADSVQSRSTRFNDQEVLEVVSPFEVEDGSTGILRIGLHLDELRA